MAVGEFEAVKRAPEDAAAMRHLARGHVKAGRKDDHLKETLERILLTLREPQWAREQLIRIGRKEGKVFPDQAENRHEAAGNRPAH